MKKPIKPITHEKANKIRIALIMLFNFYIGMIIVALYNFIWEFLETGLYHKICIFMGLVFPIGFIMGIIIVSLCTVILVIILKFDYMTYTKGIEYIKIKGEIKE